MYIPKLCKNLLLVSAMTRQKMKVEFDEAKVIITDKSQGDKVVAKGVERNGLYRIMDFVGVAPDDDSQLWHQRLGHLNYTSFATMEKEGMVVGLPSIEETTEVYEACMLGKQHRSASPTNTAK